METSERARDAGRSKALIALVAVCVLLMVAMAAAIPLALKLSSYHPYVVSSSSMEPTLYAGDKIFVNQDYYKRHSLVDGDLVVFRHGEFVVIKRISALPGETIEGVEGKLIRNGVALAEPYASFSEDRPIPEIETFASRRIADGELFVTGDSRDASLDSRSADYGPVHFADVIGRVSFIYGSQHPHQAGRSF